MANWPWWSYLQFFLFFSIFFFFPYLFKYVSETKMYAPCILVIIKINKYLRYSYILRYKILYINEKVKENNTNKLLKLFLVLTDFQLYSIFKSRNEIFILIYTNKHPKIYTFKYMDLYFFCNQLSYLRCCFIAIQITCNLLSM